MVGILLSSEPTLSRPAMPPREATWAPEEGAELIGTKAPEWTGLQWLQGGPLELAKLRGKVVFVRFWTDDCPFCEKSAPALRGLWEQYRERGVIVVGIHHPKGSRKLDDIRKAAKALGFTFPIATDLEWRTVRAYGVGTVFKKFTSVSFLIDRCGVIRFVHDGGSILEGEPAHKALIETIGHALAEPPVCPPTD